MLAPVRSRAGTLGRPTRRTHVTLNPALAHCTSRHTARPRATSAPVFTIAPSTRGHPSSERWKIGLQVLNGLTNLEKSAFAAGTGNPKYEGEANRFDMALVRLSELVEEGNDEEALAMRNLIMVIGSQRLVAIQDNLQGEMTRMPFWQIGLKDIDLVAVREWLRRKNAGM